MRDGVKFAPGVLNPKRRAAKKKRGMGMGAIGSDEKSVIDAWCQSKDPLFKVKGKERHARITAKITY